MVKRLRKRQGIGGPSQIASDPDRPTFDPATHESRTDRKIHELLADKLSELTEWEHNFLLQMYGNVPITPRQHKMIGRLHKRYCKK